MVAMEKSPWEQWSIGHETRWLPADAVLLRSADFFRSHGSQCVERRLHVVLHQFCLEVEELAVESAVGFIGLVLRVLHKGLRESLRDVLNVARSLRGKDAVCDDGAARGAETHDCTNRSSSNVMLRKHPLAALMSPNPPVR